MIPENIDGFRRTHVKSRHLSLVKERAAEYEDRGFETLIKLVGGYYYLYTKKDLKVDKEKSE